jgi:hypothetical protein
MALPPLATVDDLAAWPGIGTISTDVEAAAEAVLAAASALVRSDTGRDWLVDVDTFDDAHPPVDDDALAVARTVVVLAAGRVWRNPAGVIHDVTGPLSARFAEWVAEGLLLTPAEKDMLSPWRIAARPAVWTLATSRGDPETDGVYIPVVGSDKPLPAGEPW